MKIEMGESLICSWLKHIKKCQVVQMNWKISSAWTFENKDLIDNLMDKSNRLFAEKYGYNIYKKNTSDQLINQSEADVLGVSFDENGYRIYAVDIAFHESGLNYGSRQETTERVVKKCIRTAMCILGCFNSPYGDIIFASPKINPSKDNDIMAALEDINAVLADCGLEYNVEIYSNERFDTEILMPVIEMSDNVADTSELFMRGIQMYKMFHPTQQATEKKAAPVVEKKDTKIAQSQNDCIVGFEEMKVAEIARTALAQILESGKITPDEIEKLQTKEYSKSCFDLQFPLLLKVESVSQRPLRYMAKPILHIGGEAYYMCSEWFEKPGGNNDRPFLLKWIKEHR